MLLKQPMPDPRSPPAAVDTSTWLTCAEASDLLHCSENTLRARVRSNMLHPRKGRRVLPGAGTREVDLFDPRELGPLSRRWKTPAPNDPGELAAQAFELFEEGISQREIVIRLREAPDKVTQLHDLWLDMGGSDLVIGAQARVELERLVGPFVDMAELVTRVSSLLGERIDVTLSEEAAPEAPDEASRSEKIHGGKP